MHKPLWVPTQDRIKNSNLIKFMRFLKEKLELEFSDYKALYNWSITSPHSFWDLLWQYLDIKSSECYSTAVDDINKFPGAKWFVGAKLNYAENILKYSNNDAPAIIFRGENRLRKVIVHNELKNLVMRLATALREQGIKLGDLVAAYMPNVVEGVLAMLATAAVGAVWCPFSIELEPKVVINRLSKVKPSLLFTTDGYYHKGRVFHSKSKVQEILENVPTIKKTVVTHYAGNIEDFQTLENAQPYDDFLVSYCDANFQFEQLPAEHPLLITFTSGTTGKPKELVQSAAGLLINQLKELVLHNDFKSIHRMLYLTKFGEMPWNWQTAMLGVGGSIILYDGSPSHPETSAIWSILEDEKATVFGANAHYFHSLLAKKFSPKDHADLRHLKTISQTGTSLSEAAYKFIYSEIKEDLHLSCISGDSDISGSFATGISILPVYPNQYQAPALGMKIQCQNSSGEALQDEAGHLVCLLPTPSMPLHLCNDSYKEKYLTTYFNFRPNIWHHGDYVVFHSSTGGITFLGHTNAILNHMGNIGTQEIYNKINSFSGVKDSLIICHKNNETENILLFVQLQQGFNLSASLVDSFKAFIREKAPKLSRSPLVFEVPDIPKNYNGKKVESVIINMVNKEEIENRDIIVNPESLDYFETLLPEIHK